jgi:hypothetical protein
MKKTTDRILTAIFCDDIRHEVGNKMSFMGCYQSELFVPTTPTGLAKLCIFATAMTPVARPFKSLTFRVMLDEQTELARLDVPSDGLSNAPKILDETVTRISISTALIFSPFIIEKPTSLRLMADTDEGEIVGPRLLIKIRPSDEIEVPKSITELKPAKRRVGVKKSATRNSSTEQ